MEKLSPTKFPSCSDGEVTAIREACQLFRVTPSIYKKEMLQSTKERQANTKVVHPPRILEILDTGKTANKKITMANKHRTLFQPYPSELVFQNFIPGQNLQLQMQLHNNDKVPRQINLEPQDSENFSVVGPMNGGKVAPGMFATVTVYFSPQENKDYNHRLIFVTTKERFEVPVRAIGPRAIFDFRDKFLLPTCRFKASTEYTHLVCNIGNTKAKFTLSTQRPFSVTPSCGTLDVGKSMQVTVTFNPMTLGDHKQGLILHYDTGEDVYIRMSGTCKVEKVHLSTSSVLLGQCAISHTETQRAFLLSTSDVSLQYYWTMWPSLQEEALSLLRDTSALQHLEREAREGLLFQCESDPAALHDIPWMSKALQERRHQAMENGSLVLSNGCLTLAPAESKTWPNFKGNINIIFKPQKPKAYEETVFCDIEGCESRLPLIIKAEGVGPKLQFKNNLLDMKEIVIHDKESHEVQLINNGPIDAPFKLSLPDTTFGRCFSFSPKSGVVPRQDSQILIIHFLSDFIGDFSEKLVVSVKMQPEPAILILRGRVIGPTFLLGVSELDFGDVGFGFSKTVICSLSTTCHVNMNYTLRVLNDGLGAPSMTWRKLLSDTSRSICQVNAARDRHARPVEFIISPSAGSVTNKSDATIKVTLCANTLGTYRMALAVDVEGVGEEIMTLPINARCVVPDIAVETPELDFHRCFLDQTYERSVVLMNTSNVPACYSVLDQENEESSSLHCGSSKNNGMIGPKSSVEIPVFLVAKSVGELHHTLRIAVLGSHKPALEVVFSCIGQGPVVHVQNPKLDFGRIQVLTDITRVLHLSNESTIPAHFTTRMSSKKSFWRVEPSEGCLPPLSKLELRVVAHLKDTVPVGDRLEVSILHSQTHTVPLSAIGTGSSIVSDKPFAPSLDLGTHFSPGSCQYHFKLTNHGQRRHELFWLTNGLPSSTHGKRQHTMKSKTTNKKDILSHEPVVPLFSLIPSRVDLFPGSSVDMVLTASSDSPKVAQEQLMCRVILDGHRNPEDFMSVDVTCRFVAPDVSISPNQLNFYSEKVPGKSLKPLYEKLTLTNVSPLSLSLELSVAETFSLHEAPGAQSSAPTKSLVLGGRGEAELWVCFNPAFCLDPVSRVVDELLQVQCQGHKLQYTVKLQAQVHFPNLQFSSTTVDFGCVVNNSQTQRQIYITNSSPLPVSYRWTIIGETEEVGVNDQQSSPAVSVRLSPRPGDDEQSSTQNTGRVFDILPNHGHLQPGEKQQVTILYYGQENASREVVASCHVKHGPTYDIQLRAEASVISYSLDSPHVDFGQLLFDREGKAELTLKNTGKVGFEFSIIDPERENEADEQGEGQRKILEETDQQQSDDELNEIRPGQPRVIPNMGYINAGEEHRLCVFYLPGLPEVFERWIQLKVALLPLQDITLTGEGVFPRIRLNLPQNLSGECHSDVVHKARAAMEAAKEQMNETTTGRGATTETNCTLTNEELLHMEIDKMLVKENALAVTGRLLELRDSQDPSRKWRKLSKFLLPEYVLDFGHVIPGQVLRHTVTVTNTGPVTVSLHADLKPLAGTGFSTEFERAHNLPCGQIQMFTVKFDPEEAKLKNGDISVVMPIQILHGPVVQVQLCAAVTVPTITVSTDTLQFDTVQCGMCQIQTVQLFNHKSVPCSWSIAEEVKPVKFDKFLPLHQRKKVLQQQRPPPVVFEMNPNSGLLSPGERVNVQIKFSPTEGHAYSRQLVVSLAESNQQVFITAQGQGEEPQLQFCTSVLELGPCLPVSTEVEAEVTIKNPCSFPIEFYPLELDSQYLQEEKILRLMQGYDEKNKLLLPPRAPGEGLPKELLEYYKDYCSQLKDDAELKVGLDEKEVETGDTHEEEKRPRENDSHPSDSQEEGTHTTSVETTHLLISEMSKEESSRRLGQLEMTPVSRALARHMAIDLSPEGLAACNRRGIAVIVYGAPLTDKSSTAAALARHYGGACLSVDAVVTDVLLNGTTPVSLSARQLYDRAAEQYAEKKAVETVPGPAADPEASDPAPKVDPVSHDTVETVGQPSEDSRNDSNAPQETGNTASALRLGGDVTTLSNLLPEQLLVDILAERFQLSDCHRGIMIDGLDSVYTQSAASTLQVVLKALNDRKLIYVVNLSDSYSALKERERAQRETEEALEKEEADREERWFQELDEEQYDALPDEEKERIIQQQRKELKQKKLRELKRIEEQQEEMRCQQELEKKLKEEEELRKKKKGRKKDVKEVSKDKSSPERKQSLQSTSTISSRTTSKESLVDTREQQWLNEACQSRRAADVQKQTEETEALDAESLQPKDELEGENSCVEELQFQFLVYEQTRDQVQHILVHWDRVQGLLLVPLPTEEAPQEDENDSTGSQTPVGKKSKKASGKTTSPLPNQRAADRTGDKVSLPDIIPHMVLNVTGKDDPSTAELLKLTLPSLDELLDHLGLRRSDPVIPPPVTFSIVPFPKHRQQSNTLLDCFTFLVPSRLDEQTEKKDSEDVQPSVVKEEAAAGPSDSRSRAIMKESVGAKDQDKKGKKKQRRKKQTPSAASSVSDITEPTQQDQHKAALELKRSQSLRTFRWVVPANGEVALRIWFYSDSPGIFEQTFNFELLGTQRSYQLLCRGLCTYPSFCKDYRTLFAPSKKVQQMQEGIQKTYVIEPGYFEFGPLLCGKTRDRYKENRYPENAERLMIHNNSGLEAEVQFRFQHDTQATTYLLDPPAMTLKPDEKQELTVWAYPTKVGQIKDSVLFSIKDNPELVVIDLSCCGVQPELQLENKDLHFDRILLYRQQSRSVTLHNKTALPVFWRLHGLEELGDEFIVPQDQGIVPSNSSFPLTLHFKAKKPLHIKKMLRLEVCDEEKILGIVHIENIMVTAEAYDIGLDISPNGSLDFGTIEVFKESKLSLKMKNTGKYEIAYEFVFKGTSPTQPKLGSIFSISPQRGTLKRLEKSTMQIICRPDTAVSFNEEEVLLCQLLDPSIGFEGEPIAVLPLKVSITSAFSRYNITPACDINFGPLVYGSKKSQSFTIENNGIFETRFMIVDPAALRTEAADKTSQDSDSDRLSTSSSRGTSNFFPKRLKQTHLNMGVFSVSPCTGSLQPGSQQVVTVNCVAEQLGIWNQDLLIDISDRDPSDHPAGIPYRLMADICKPGIELDMDSIFEEHHICHDSSQLSSQQFCNAEGIYVQEENKFIFNKALVGRAAQARFKLTNEGKVPCVVSLAIKYVRAKTACNVEAFGLSATTLSIPSQSHSFAVVNFTPETMRLYSAVFEASVETPYRVTPTFKTKVLEFELMGEGSLPHVSLLRPAVINSRGNLVLQFRRVSTGHKRTRPLVLLNDGNVPAQVQLDMLDKYGVFSLKAAPGNTCSSINSTRLQGTTDSDHQLVHRAILRMDVNEEVEFEVSFDSDKPLNAEAQMTLQVEDNHDSNAIIEVTGEAYQEIVSLYNLNRSSQPVDHEDDEEDYYDMLDFGDCHVKCPYQESFTMTNHSSSQAVRFEWPPAGPHVCFSPQVGHLHAECSKEVTVTFCSNEPVTLTSQPMRCKLSQVTFQTPVDQVADWDDRRASGMPQQNEENEVMEIDPEPCHSVVEGSQHELELRIKAVCDYVKFSCDTDTIHFNDTLIHQTSLQQLQMVNKSNVKLEFSFQVKMDSRNNNVRHHQGDGTHALRLRRRSSGVVTGARPASALSRQMSPLVGSPAPLPISVEPSIGAIESGAQQILSLRFSPLEVAKFQGRLVCSIPNLEDGDQAPCISVFGCSLMTLCHFDLDDSDDVHWVHNNPQLRGPRDPNTRVMKFNALGFSSTSTRRFTVLNPTSETYSFKWRCKDTGDSPFHCLKPRGTIHPGRKVEMCFKYDTKGVDVVESLWSFEIETQSFSVPFLCVGTTREPQVYFDKTHLDFGELLVGRKVEQTVHLVNGEEEPFHFSVGKASLLCADLQQSSLIVQPMTGTVEPQNRFPLSVSFTPCREGNVSFRLVLRVRGKSEPLGVTVKASCFTMSASVQVKNPDGGLREIEPNSHDTLDFGKVELSEQSMFKFLVTNQARFSLDVKYDLTGPSELLQHLEANTKHATIEAGGQLESSLIFSPQSKCNLQDVRLSIKIKHGPTLTFAINGWASEPDLEFSFKKYNFGKHFLYRTGMMVASKTLVLRNKSKEDISVQSRFTNTSYLEMDFQPNVLSGGAVMEVPLKFYPRKAKCYQEKLTFVLNSCVTKHVEVRGEGKVMWLGLMDPSRKKVNLGSLMAGQKVKKQVVLVNRSGLEVSFSLQLKSETSLQPKDLSFSPAGEVTLKACGGMCVVDIQFSPRQYMPPFTAELQAQIADLLHPLLTLQGCCKEVEIQLDQDHLTFGAVIQHCQVMKKIVMKNTGDTLAKFQWDTTHFPPDLSIKPAKGVIHPGKRVPVEVTLAPVELNNDIRYEKLSCCVEGSSSPLTLTVTGSCIEASPNKEVVNFVCPVRGSHTQTLQVCNPTNQRCTIMPKIKGKQWSAAPSLILGPLQEKEYSITYNPVTITADGKKHQGSVFFSFPDGTGLLHSLQGTAEPPKAENTFGHELPAKTELTQFLPVHNWLSKQQRFHVLTEILKPAKPDATVSLKGLKFIEVPALARKDYKLTFLAYREGQYQIKVTFRNMESGEYLFYLISLEVTSPGVLSTTKVTTTVRQRTTATTEVENPLPTASCLTTECKCPDIRVPPQLTVPGQSKCLLRFDYQPLHAGDSTARLTLYNNDLGSFHYDLLLRALPPPPEKTVDFSTSLGSSHSVQVKFISHSPVKTEYSCKTDCPDFTVVKSVIASARSQKGSETSVEVRFEPHQLGDARGQLILFSDAGGEYIFPLQGTCLPAKPHGLAANLISIQAGSTVSIPFKNIFQEAAAFSVKVDKPCFAVKEVGTILPKGTQNILITFKAPRESPGPMFGNLVVSSQSPEGHNKPCAWVYHLKGLGGPPTRRQ